MTLEKITLECVRTFGNFTPGDRVTVPDGAAYDRAYFAEVTAAKPDTPAKDGEN